MQHKKHSFLQNIFWVIKYNSKEFYKEVLPLFILRILQELLPIASMYLFADILSKISVILFTHSYSDISLNNVPFMTSVYKYIAIVVFSQFIDSLKSYIFGLTDSIRKHRLELNYYQRLKSFDLQLFEDAQISNTITKAEEKLDVMNNIFTTTIETIASIFGVITSLLIIIRYNYLIAIIVVLTGSPTIIIESIRNKEFRAFWDSWTERNRKTFNAYHTLTNVEKIPENTVNGVSQKLIDFANGLRLQRKTEYLDIYKKITRARMLFSLPGFFDLIAGYLIIKQTIENQGGIGNVSFYWSQATRINSKFTTFMANLVYLTDQSDTVEYLRDFFDLKPQVTSGRTKLTEENPNIEMENVSFKYPESENYSLKNINLKITPGDEIALVGQNGAGKTTLIKLILRLYDPTEGRILVDGVDVKELDLEDYYSRIAVLFQDFNTYTFFSVKQNVDLAKTKYSISYEEAVKYAEISEDISRLKNKEDHLLSKSYTNGVEMSKGQKQKLAIARMFHRNTPILILDEPTASIDAVSESNIFNKVFESSQSKTIIIISHRFSTVRKAKKIYVLHKGEIVEQGSHSELMEINGIYAESFNLQASGYKERES